MAWTTPEEVLVRWIGDQKPQENDETLAILIEDVEDEILRLFPKIQERIDSNILPIERVKRVVASATIRLWKVGQNHLSQFAYTTGPFAHSGTVASDSKSISLTDEEREMLSPPKSGKVFTTSTAPRAHSHSLQHCGVIENAWDLTNNHYNFGG